MADAVILQTNIKEIPLFRRGKVRDVYDLGDELLIVSTDRISCFDVVLPTGIPGKGKILTQLSLFWFSLTKDIVANHLISADVADYPAVVQPYWAVLEGRSMLVKKTVPFPVECIVRGYLSGSGWKDYQRTGAVCGIPLPAGLRESDKLPEDIFTPSTKAEQGHDENIAHAQVERQIGTPAAARLRQLSLAIYRRAREYALPRGIIIADTKFEFGRHGEEIILIDEVLTPDSSRFWPQDDYRAGSAQPSFDKQFVRDYLETLDWDKTPPGPALPEEIVVKTRQKYEQALSMLAYAAG
ncbi:MAG: phosphoribosylaminoimidazolesuccinocarboxamide synthase [Candidatus Omnitrophica bacterium]|nr:phosphoribosylaminoimidazolesuccinocarboxamide synthase [Candidatus Omnitrophota bacterium]